MFFLGDESGRNSREVDNSASVTNDLNTDGHIEDCLTNPAAVGANAPLASSISSNTSADLLWDPQISTTAHNSGGKTNSKLSTSSDIGSIEHMKDTTATSAPAKASNILYTSSISLLSNGSHRCGSEYASKVTSTLQKDE